MYEEAMVSSASNPWPGVRKTLEEMNCLINMKWEITGCNKSYAKKLGYAVSDIIRTALFDHIPEDDRQHMMDLFDEWRKTSVMNRRKIRMLTKEGTVVTMRLAIKARYGLDAGKIGGSLTLFDAVELEELQSLLRIKKYESLYENSPDMYRTINYMGIILDCNRSYRQRLGYTKEEIIGTNLLEHTAQKSRNSISTNMENWRKTGVTKPTNMWLRKKDGTEFPVTVTPTNLYDDDGMLIGRNVVINDMTEMHTTKQILGELEKIDRMKEEFLSAITHELKTPLTPIIGFTQTLLKPQLMGALTEKQEGAIKIVLTNATRLKNMISDLLDAHKMELGKMRFENMEIGVQELLASINNSYQYTIKEKKITLDCRGGSGVIINSDRARIEQVIVNMINNAIDFVPAETGRIDVSVEMAGDFVKFTVRDNGSGIPKEKQQQLFKKFYQGDTAATRKHGGTGLGLSICRGIVENLGGSIGCRSEEGVGSEFYFTIPIGSSQT